MTEPRARNVLFSDQRITVEERPGEIEDCPGCGSYSGIHYESVDLNKDRKPDLFCVDNRCVIFNEKYRSQAARLFHSDSLGKLQKNLGNADQQRKADQMFDGFVSGGLALFADFKSAVTQSQVTVERRSFMGSPSSAIIFRGDEVFLDRKHSGMTFQEELEKGVPISSVAIVDYSSSRGDGYQYTMYTYESLNFCQPIQAELKTLETRAFELVQALYKERE